MMLNANARKVIVDLCAVLDRKGLEEIMELVKIQYDLKIRKELEEWVPGQRVLVKVGNGRLKGVILSVNRQTITVDIGKRRVRVQPQLLQKE